ncbi:MAG: VWA domain-containing protein, partial [Chloroflexi bacterium]|nr:VWA domain-containing protein [Chloroflexota bacterium]
FGNATDPFDEIHKHLSKAKGVRFGIVLADGVWSHQAGAIERARRCHRDEIDIIAIGFGGADEEFLRKISSRSDLGFFTDLNSLTETFSTIAQELTESGGHLDSQSMSRIRGRISR